MDGVACSQQPLWLNMDVSREKPAIGHIDDDGGGGLGIRNLKHMPD